MKKIDKATVKPGTLLYPLPVVMVTVGSMDKNNVITIGWTGIINTEPPILYISVRKSRYSYDILTEKREFVINLTNEKLLKATDFAGVKSGREIDKVEKLGLTLMSADIVSAPMIAESPVNLECKVMEIREFKTHDMFIAEVVSVHISKEFIGENGFYDFGKMNLISYNHGGYYGLDNNDIGRFGFSIMKPKTKKRKEKEKLGAKRRAARNKSVLNRRKKSSKKEKIKINR